MSNPPPSPEPITKVSIVISKGSLDGIYPGLIMANGARMEGIEANLFFTFFGLYGVMKDYQDKIRIATVGNSAMRVPSAKGFQLPTLLGAIPGMSAFATSMMQKEMEALDIPPIGEFVEMISDAGGHLYACKATVDMFHLTPDDFVPQMEKVLTVGDFYELAAGGQIIFT
ncbi:DsrE/DsrF/DrsH-like family protein [Synoicihabitans lomoniglobus]|uniref:DsrE/DsrF/DrsH-like family protein n=1 Tax=Synoicihabitans lomoniglobus TaxID=2909285 RepID=A0AAE9ZVI8_9BACT|nr:DsrE/DsrF/DrsH-like family protein [Opitutaceae bacterium LMO-M01]WED64921.1 DsrE/DsrF/DrsH-like family protein [Opitutaceae bacterium LMO-M01]